MQKETVTPLPLDTKKIRRLRMALKLTQQEASRLAGLSSQRWSEIERGRFPDLRLSTIEAVCRVLKCGVDALRR